ncbi:unnamed protein product [Triticum turgidum subsp. durum]|uniref:RING-type domain-containing protein n=1 Tax=Triticum turgidum subsp. durum TaxID=4567 RepID=A0A9R0R002_TRITD|nr:unnamed protein product [Triticum turgidum subsp. durum]
MPAQKRPHPSPDADDGHVREEEAAAAAGAAGSDTEGGGGVQRAANGGSAELAKDGGGGSADSDAGEDDEEEEQQRKQQQQQDEHEEGGGSGGDDEDSDDSPSSESDAADVDEFILVKLMDIRKEVQCPICLGIIRKTRTVMECLHRFCRDCIDKSMRLGNNECPACRTHCKSRRSLRDDPNFDALILALYPDIDKYEEEELAFGEEEKTRNKKIQDSIAETFRRQTEALVKKRSNAKAIASTRKTRGSMRTKKRGRTSSPDNAPTDIDDDEREENGNDGSKESSSVDDRSPDVKMKRARRWPVPRSSPAKTMGSVDSSYEENDDLGGARDILATSPLRGEMLAWGKNGTRSQTRHGSAGGSSGRMVKGGRVAKLVDHLRNADEFDTKFNLYLALTPVDGQSMPKLEKSYLSCQPTFSVSHLCQFVALQLSRQAQEVEIYFRKKAGNGSLKTEENSAGDEAKPERLHGLERLKEENSLSELYPMLASGVGDLELLYSVKAQA